MNQYKDKLMLSKYSIRFGMTFGQLISILGLAGSLIAFVIASQVQIADINAKIINVDIKYQLKYEALEAGRVNNAEGIEVNRTENREEHQILSNKLDMVIEKLNNR